MNNDLHLSTFVTKTPSRSWCKNIIRMEKLDEFRNERA